MQALKPKKEKGTVVRPFLMGKRKKLEEGKKMKFAHLWRKSPLFLQSMTISCLKFGVLSFIMRAIAKNDKKVL